MTNYFELYQLPVSFSPNAVEVKKKYYELSRQHHPDRTIQTDGAEKVAALTLAAQINDAFTVLRSPDATMAYLLKLHNLLQDEEKYSLPPTFLMEMMDLNEIISELQPNDTQALQQATQLLQIQLQQWQTEVEPLTKSYDAAEKNDPLLLKIKDYYFRKKYLLRIKERIDNFAAR